MGVARVRVMRKDASRIRLVDSDIRWIGRIKFHKFLNNWEGFVS